MKGLFFFKKYKYILSVFFFFFLLILPTKSSAVTEVNSGFVSGIWYSQTPFFAGDNIRIYTAIQNQAGFDIKGKIRFYDNNEIIGESEFSSISGHLIEEWIDWSVTEGEHKIRVEIIDPVKSSPGSDPEPVRLLSDSSPTDTQYADVDTDKDGIGNKEDPDDDNDGITDEEEIKLGTDPLVYDEKTEDDSSEKTEEETKDGSASSTETSSEETKTKTLDAIKNALNFVDDKVTASTQKIILSLEKKVNKIEADSQNENGVQKEKTFLEKFYSISLTSLIWMFNHKWALYGTILIISILIWKIFRFFSRRR